MAPIAKLLVANRGEIALRVFRTCRELEIATVAVVAPDDAGALHARSADEAVAIESYLDAGEHVRAARETGADAIHPGYGFLAESAAFAEAVLAAGLTWVGPPPAALRAGGDKLESKRVARAAGIPVLETGEPAELGYPLLVKAAAGGGGRGMRVVRRPEELEEALAAARREAQGAFGDDTVFCERYLERPRHIEVQLLADRHGRAISVGERDCSVQRRHQKVLEEAPAPGLDEPLRVRLGEAAVGFAEAIGYEGAGTAEFVVAGDAFFFLELNARIQVEHPVTESVSGRDLVADQLWIAQGGAVEAVSRGAIRGHAIEVRLYAEDPRTFLPQAGTIERLRLPASVRVDAGVEEGDEVGTSYDPMIAKLIAQAPTRGEAITALEAALVETEVAGLITNLPFLRWLLAHPRFRAGELSTAFLTDYPPLSAPPADVPESWRASFRLNLPSPPVAAAPDVDDLAAAAGLPGARSEIVAPMPGTVVRVVVDVGDDVVAGQPLVVLEAMKMELPLVATHAARVEVLDAVVGDRVPAGTILVRLTVPGEADDEPGV